MLSRLQDIYSFILFEEIVLSTYRYAQVSLKAGLIVFQLWRFLCSCLVVVALIQLTGVDLLSKFLLSSIACFLCFSVGKIESELPKRNVNM